LSNQTGATSNRSRGILERLGQGSATITERDGFLASGMEGGLNETYSRLDEVLARIAAE
jgi:hypothetical protein